MRNSQGHAAVWCTAVLLLASCTSGDPVPQTAGESSPTVSASASTTPSGAPVAPTPSQTDTATVPASPRASAAADTEPPAPPPAPTATTAPQPPPPRPDQPSGIPAPAANPAAQFRECSEEYLTLTENVTLSASVTPVVIEGWSEVYQAAAARAAEGDYTAAAQQCSQLVQSIRRATG